MDFVATGDPRQPWTLLRGSLELSSNSRAATKGSFGLTLTRPKSSDYRERDGPLDSLNVSGRFAIP